MYADNLDKIDPIPHLGEKVSALVPAPPPTRDDLFKTDGRITIGDYAGAANAGGVTWIDGPRGANGLPQKV